MASSSVSLGFVSTSAYPELKATSLTELPDSVICRIIEILGLTSQAVRAMACVNRMFAQRVPCLAALVVGDRLSTTAQILRVFSSTITTSWQAEFKSVPQVAGAVLKEQRSWINAIRGTEIIPQLTREQVVECFEAKNLPILCSRFNVSDNPTANSFARVAHLVSARENAIALKGEAGLIENQAATVCKNISCWLVLEMLALGLTFGANDEELLQEVFSKEDTQNHHLTDVIEFFLNMPNARNAILDCVGLYEIRLSQNDQNSIQLPNYQCLFTYDIWKLSVRLGFLDIALDLFKGIANDPNFPTSPLYQKFVAYDSDIPKWVLEHVEDVDRISKFGLELDTPCKREYFRCVVNHSINGEKIEKAIFLARFLDQSDQVMLGYSLATRLGKGEEVDKIDSIFQQLLLINPKWGRSFIGFTIQPLVQVNPKKAVEMAKIWSQGLGRDEVDTLISWVVDNLIDGNQEECSIDRLVDAFNLIKDCLDPNDQVELSVFWKERALRNCRKAFQKMPKQDQAEVIVAIGELSGLKIPEKEVADLE